MAAISKINGQDLSFYSKINGLPISFYSKVNGLESVQNPSVTIYATIDSSVIDSNLIDFPVGVQIDNYNGFLTGANENSHQYLHATVGGQECYVEVDVYDVTNSRCVLWIKVPSVSSSIDTAITLNYGDYNPTYVGTTGTAAAQNVWDSGYIGVYHHSDDPSLGTLQDSTANGNDGIINGSMLAENLEYSGLGYSHSLDGINDSYTLPIAPGSSGTMDAASYWTNTTVSQALLANGFRYSSNYGSLLMYRAGGSGFRIYTGNQNSTSFIQPGTIPGTHSVSLTSNGNTHEAFRDGVFIFSRTDAISGYYTESYVCDEASTGAKPFNGKQSETRVSAIVRSNSWIKATHAVFNKSLVALST